MLPSSGFAAGLDVQADAYAQLADRRGRAGARARGHHPGGEAQGGQSGRRRDRDAVRAAARPASHPSLAHRARAGAARAHARRDDAASTATSIIRATRCSSIVGDVDPDEAMREVTARYGALPAGDAGAHRRARRGRRGGLSLSRVDGRHRADAARVRLAHAGHARIPTRRRSTCSRRCSAAGRASRLYRAVRERKLASSVSRVRLHADGARRVRRARRDAAGARRAKRRARSGSSCARCATSGVGDDELARAKRVVRVALGAPARGHGRAGELSRRVGGARRLAHRATTTSSALLDDDARTSSQTSRSGISIPEQARRRGLSPDGERAGRGGRRRDARAARRARRPRALAAARPYRRAPRRRSHRRCAREREEAGVRVYRTPAGVPILVRRKAGAPLVHAGVFALGGARDETARAARGSRR